MELIDNKHVINYDMDFKRKIFNNKGKLVEEHI